jgi:hypothetical protein
VTTALLLSHSKAVLKRSFERKQDQLTIMGSNRPATQAEAFRRNSILFAFS